MFGYQGYLKSKFVLSVKILIGTKRGRINPEIEKILSPLTSEEYESLEQSINEEGCREPILTWNDTIVDGHNRYEICQKNFIQFETKEMKFDSILDVINNQFARRNLTTFQRAELALWKEKAREKQKRGGEQKACQKSDKPIDTKKELAKKADVSHDTIYKVKTIIKEKPEMAEYINKGDNQIVKEKQKAEQPKNIEYPEGKYQVIVIDPPWDIEKIIREERPNQNKTMSIDEIKQYPIENLADTDCHLWLWTTHKYLPKAFDILGYWGFKYT